MKRFLLLFLMLSPFYGISQQTEDALIFFTDKEDVAYAIANPITILTQEAIDRKNLHGIEIDERDVPLNENYKAQIASTSGITVLAKSKWMNALYVRGTQNSIESLLDLPFVSGIEFMDKTLNSEPLQPRPARNKFEIENPERIQYNYGTAQNQVEMIKADYLHRQNYTGTGITVAFLDNGYPNIHGNPAFQQLRDENRLLGYYDFVARLENPDGTGSHGAHTLSTAAAILENTNPSFSYTGTAPAASYYLFITEDGHDENPVEEAYWVEALERADSLGVYVTNTSLGYQDFPNYPRYDYQYSDMDGQTTIGARGGNHAFDKGMLNVVSAGNAAAGFGYITSPGDSPGVLTVGAVDENGDYAWFSSFGPTYDQRVKPDVMAQGMNAAIVNYNGELRQANGTSFSAPIIAGAIASLWQAAPHLKNETVMQVVRESAHLFNNPTDLMGYGIPDFEEAFNTLIQLGIEEELQNNLFAIYPNPVTTEFFISFPQNSEQATVSLYNAIGQKILTKQLTPFKNKISVVDLPSGLYIASIHSDRKTVSFKIIKQ